MRITDTTKFKNITLWCFALQENHTDPFKNFDLHTKVSKCFINNSNQVKFFGKKDKILLKNLAPYYSLNDLHFYEDEVSATEAYIKECKRILELCKRRLIHVNNKFSIKTGLDIQMNYNIGYN